MSYREIVDKLPQDVKLVVVTKTQPIESIQDVYEQGCRDFGENRVQDALPKLDALPDDIRWHFIGSLQKNKVKKVVGRFDLIHSVDCLELAREISRLNNPTKILLQVNTSGEASKQGFSVEEFERNLSLIRALPNIDVRGLMTMAPLTEDREIVRSCFRELRLLRDKHSLNELSMGMSHDWQIAVEEGATIVRIGTAIFKGS